MMRIRLVAVNPERFSLGLAYLEAALADRFSGDVQVGQAIFELSEVRRAEIDLAAIVEDIAADRPDVVGLSWYCWNHRLIQDLARILRLVLPDAHLLVGGPEARTIDDSELTRFPDGTIFVFGEGESPICQVVDQLLRTGECTALPAGSGRHDSGAVTRSARPEAATATSAIPSPILSGTLRPASSDWVPSYATTRGCVYRCSFCAWQDGFREREFDLEQVDRELAVLAGENYERIWITDTIFGRNEPRTLAILRRLERWPHPTKFAVELHARYLSAELARALARVPLAWAAVGIQSLAPDVLKLTRRSPHTDQLIESVSRLYEVVPDRSAIHLDVIFGLPHQTLPDCFETVDMLLDTFPEATIFVGMLQVLPGTAFESLLHEPGWVVLPPEADCEVVATPHLSRADMARIRDLTVGLDAYALTGDLGPPDLGPPGSTPTTSERLESLGRALRGTAFAAHPVYGRRESHVAEQVTAALRASAVAGV